MIKDILTHPIEEFRELWWLVTSPRLWSWQGAMGLMIATGIFVVTCVLTIGVAVKLSRGLLVAGSTVALLTAALAALIGANAAFLGRMSRSDRTLGGGQ